MTCGMEIKKFVVRFFFLRIACLVYGIMDCALGLMNIEGNAPMLSVVLKNILNSGSSSILRKLKNERRNVQEVMAMVLHTIVRYFAVAAPPT